MGIGTYTGTNENFRQAIHEYQKFKDCFTKPSIRLDAKIKVFSHLCVKLLTMTTMACEWEDAWLRKNINALIKEFAFVITTGDELNINVEEIRQQKANLENLKRNKKTYRTCEQFESEDSSSTTSPSTSGHKRRFFPKSSESINSSSSDEDEKEEKKSPPKKCCHKL
jgi:hypothetical protein